MKRWTWPEAVMLFVSIAAYAVFMFSALIAMDGR